MFPTSPSSTHLLAMALVAIIAAGLNIRITPPKYIPQSGTIRDWRMRAEAPEKQLKVLG